MADSELILEIDMDKLSTTMEIVKIINKYRPSLELPICYNINSKMSALLNGYGRAVSYVAEKAVGKGDVIKTTKKIFDRYNDTFLKEYATIDVDKFTPAFFVKLVSDLKLQNKNFELIMEDLSTTIDTHYLALQMYNTISKLLSDKIIGQGTQDVFAECTGLNIEDVGDVTVQINSLSASLGMTNLILRKLKKYDGYQSMWKDRITNFYLILTATDKKYIDDTFNFNPNNQRIPCEKIRQEILEILPTNLKLNKMLPLNSEIKNNYETYKMAYLTLYKYQHTTNRGTTYFNGDLSANALINGRTEIDLTDIAFYMLYMPNLYLDKFKSTIQRVAQNVLWCNDIFEMADYIGSSPEYIRKAIMRTHDADTILKIVDDDYLDMADDFKDKIIEQQVFIKRCLK